MKQFTPLFGGTQMLQSDTKNKDITKNLSNQRGFESMVGASDNFVNYAKQLEQNDADTNMSLEFSKWYNEATAKPQLTTAEALDMGVEDNPALWETDDEGNQLERDNIDLWEVLPDLAKGKYDKLTDKYGQNLSGYGAQQEWINRRRVAGEQIYGNMLASQREQLFERAREKHDMSIDAALQSGDNFLAVELAQTYPGTDVERQERMLEVGKKVETNSYNRAIQQANETGEVGTLLELADWIDDPANYSKLDEDQQTAWSNTLRNTAKSIVGTKTKVILGNVDSMNVLYQSQKEIEDWGGAMQTLADMQTAMVDAGEPHYLGKQWYAQQVAEMTKAQVEQQDYLENAAAFAGAATGGYAYKDATDADVKKDIDRYAEETIGAGFLESPEAGYAAIRDVIRSAAAFQYMPKYLEAQINMANSPAVTPQHLQTIAQIYANVQAYNPMLLSNMDDKTQLMAAGVYQMNMAGGDLMESFNQLRGMFATKSESEVETLTQEWTNYRDSKQQPTKGMMESFIRQAKGMPFVPDVIEQLWNDLDSQGVSSTMMDAFDTLSEKYYVMNGGDKETAMRAAFGKVINTWQVSNTNGRKRYMRDAPEYRYGASAEDINGDFKSWSSEQSWYEEGADYIIASDIATSQENRPGYAVYKMEDGMPVPATDVGGKFARYYPRIEQMAEKKKLQEMNKAIWDRQWAQATSTYQGATKATGDAAYFGYEARKARYEKRKSEKASEKDAEDQAQQAFRTGFVEQRATEMKQDREIMEKLGISGTIQKDEGFRDKSYIDTEGHLTGGTGHKLTAEERKIYPEGTKIPKEVTDRWFKEDIKKAEEGASRLLKEHGLEDVPSEFRDTIINMVFQMGEAGVRGFKKMWAHAKEGNMEGVKAEMKDSKWAKQTPNRVASLLDRLNMG